MPWYSTKAAALFSIFFPYAAERHRTAVNKNIRFVHYTHADAAVNIIRTKEVWMRRSSCMDDFMEVRYGVGRFLEGWASAQGREFQAALDEAFPGLSEEIRSSFDDWIPIFENDTYLTSMSEHLDGEDRLGRLSMWRARGRVTGVAMVMNNDVFLRPSDALRAYTSPVAYLDAEGIQTEFGTIARSLRRWASFLAGQDRDRIRRSVFEMFKYAILCNKHPGFAEEKEWRVIYSPTYQRSDRLVRDVKVIGGVPQQIYKIPLRNFPEEGYNGAEIPELLERIIIGPTEYPVAVKDAFVDLLMQAGVKDAAAKVWVSDIPIRMT